MLREGVKCCSSRQSGVASKSATIVVATRKRADSLRRTLASLVEQVNDRGNWHAIIVDNAGDHATERVVEAFRDRIDVRYIIETTPGQNAARNRALQEPLGELVIFTDDDTPADANWLATLGTTAHANPDADFFGGKIIPVWPTPERPWHADAWFASFAFADQDLGDNIRDYGGCFPSSPNMAIRRRVFDSGICFDDGIGPIGSRRISGSEAELFSRLIAAGRRGVYNPRAVIYHQISERMLESSYLRKRCFAMGMGMAVWQRRPSVPHVLGVPRYRIGEFLRSNLGRIGAWLRRNEQAAVEHACRSALQAGYCYGTWMRLEQRRNHPVTTAPMAEDR